MKEYVIMVVGLVLIALVLYLMIRYSSKFRNKAYQMFIFAENNLGTGRKMDFVVNEIYNLLPTPFKILPKSFYKKILQKMFDEIKDLLDDGRINNKKKVVN